MRRMEKRKKPSLGSSRFLWDPAPTKLFLKLWLENIDGLRGSRVNTQIHREMADKMYKYGPNHIEIKAKMDNMTKKYRIEMTRKQKTGEPSTWMYFKPVHEILKESTLVNLSLCMADSFDFSPLEDSDSSDSVDSNWDWNLPAKAKIKPEPSKSPEAAASVKSDSADSTDSFAPAASGDSERILQIEEAKLVLQREKLRVMKSIADELSAIHRDFLKAYKHK